MRRGECGTESLLAFQMLWQFRPFSPPAILRLTTNATSGPGISDITNVANKKAVKLVKSNINIPPKQIDIITIN
ncbi:hypothetical protein PMEGAPR236_52040 [Priestia megaterium]